MAKKKKKNHKDIKIDRPETSPTISVCLIAKNEEKFLDQCLRSVKSIADEIIFVDTGSTDRTLEIAGKYTDKIYFHPWNDSFSEARNHYLKYAKGDWIFQIDADEELVREDIPNVIKAVQDKNIDAVMIQIVNTSRKDNSKGVFNVERIFRNNGVIHYEGRVHNQLVGITSAKFYPIKFIHYGYDPFVANDRKKFERTVSLLKKDLEENPDNPFTHHYLSCSYLSRKMDNETIEHGLKAISLAEIQDNHSVMFLWTHYNISLSYYRLNDLNMAENIANKALAMYPDHIDSHCMMIFICFNQKRWKDLIYHADRYLKLLDILYADPAHFGTLSSCSLNEAWNIHVLMGIASYEIGDPKFADFIEKAVKAAPEPFLAARAAGIYFSNAGVTEYAKSYLELADKLHPGNETVKKCLEGLAKKKATISCVMIVKNEEVFLEKCLLSVKDWVDEIIIVDTGSTDRTVEIAKRYTDKMYFHPWKDSFSKARNQALAYATCDWIFQIDADEELVQEDTHILLDAVQNEEIEAILVQIVSTLREGKSESIHSVERIFRNNRLIHYEGRVHERVVGIKNAKVYPIRLTHYGYDLGQTQSRKKFDRTVPLLKMDLEDDPENPKTYHYLGCSYLSERKYQQSLDMSLTAIRLAEVKKDPNMIYLWSHYNAAISYYQLKELDKAEEIGKSALKKYPDHIDSHYVLSLVYFDQKKWSQLIDHGNEYVRLIKLIKTSPEHFDNLVTCAVNEEWNVQVLIGIAYFELDQVAKSNDAFEMAFSCAPEPFIALRAAGIYFYNKKYLNKSLEYLQRTHHENPDDPTVNSLIAQIEKAGVTEAREPTISCCMIVKNEEAFLDQCVKSVRDYVDEIIIVDTGSTDRTVEIARQYTDKVYLHPWEGSFSKARNQALGYATCDWIFQIDGDEELVCGSGEKIREAVRDAGPADAFHVNIISTYSNGAKRARHNFERLFRNNGVIHYEGIVHNRVEGASKIKESKIELMHYGYDVDEKKAHEKFLRTSDLLKKQIAENPGDPMPHHYLGTSYLSRGMNEDAARESVKAIELAERKNDDHPLYLWARHNAAIAFFRMGDLDKAKQYSLDALRKYPEHLDSYYTLTMVAGERGQWRDVLSHGARFLELRDIFEKNPERAGLVINTTMNEVPSVHLLIGHAWHALGEISKMQKEYQLAADLAADLTKDKWQAWWNAGCFHMDRSQDLGRARSYLNIALDESPEEQDIWYMLAKLNKESKLFQEEKKCLEKLFELGNRGTMILNRLALLRIESGEEAKALEVLNEVLRIEPTNYPALCNLGRVYKHQNLMDQAIEAFTKALKIDSHGIDPLMGLGEISLQLDRFDEARTFFESVLSLQPGLVKALLYLCEIELRQDRTVEFIHWCDLLLKELQLNRNRTLHTIEDLSVILHEINMALSHDSALSTQVSDILSLLPGSRH
ncbi:MAG: glycosyltransferase [Pseudomonadota bacterium]